ncbi:MAG: cupin domain-containing protein [Gemmatimonas sp.]|nr:cupin domain-containing protein [Gemmatimonas sp.]
MARTGDVIEHPVSGETMVFLQTGEDTSGQLLQVDLFVRPESSPSGSQIHPHQEKRFVVKRGWMMLRVGGKLHVLGAGDEAIVSAGTPHIWWNCGFDEVNAILELRPAGRYEEVVSTLFGLAKAGQVKGNGEPSFLQKAVTFEEYRDTIRLSEHEPIVQRIAVSALAVVGRTFGLRPDYPYPRSARVNGGLEIWRTEPTISGSMILV